MRTHAAAWTFAWLMAASLMAASLLSAAPLIAGPIGIFTGQSDVGSVAPPGTAEYDPGTRAYALRSAGANTWYHVDGFHFLWTKLSGDWALTADITFPAPVYGHIPDPHRKGILMFRQNLDAGSAYAGVGAHGSGMTALQYRREPGANTEDVELNVELPHTVRIEKRGDNFTLYLSLAGEPMHQVGASTSLHLKSPYYVGLGAVSHDIATTDIVHFSHVALQPIGAAKNGLPTLYSTLRILQIEDQFRRAMVIRSGPGYMQATQWNPNGKRIYVDEDGHLESIALLDPPAGAAPNRIAVGELVDCSGNYGLSPDGKWLAVSCAHAAHGQHDIYILQAGADAAPRKLTNGAESSFFHAWAPDGKTLAFTRGSDSKADIFTVAATGGPESRLTRDTVNDGPDFSPDGRFIYFDSSRFGTTQIWRMQRDGSQPEQLTADDAQNSSPHVSPDGKSLAFLSRPRMSALSIGDAELKVMAFGDGLIRTVARFQGNRGSLAMNSWGDANHLAFVSYQMLQ